MIESAPALASILIRRARSSDLSSILSLSKLSTTYACWSSGAFERYLQQPEETDPTRRAIFIASAALPQPAAEPCIGFAAFTVLSSTGIAELENMAVAPEWQRQGIGLRLLATGILWCRSWRTLDAQLMLEVRASNRSAIAFYLASGFRETGRRPAYYANPQEDAVLMTRPLEASSQ